MQIHQLNRKLTTVRFSKLEAGEPRALTAQSLGGLCFKELQRDKKTRRRSVTADTSVPGVLASSSAPEIIQPLTADQPHSA